VETTGGNRGQQGAVIVEFAISILLWLTITMFAIDLARIGFTQVKLELALRRASLWGTYGQLLPPETTRVGSIKRRVIEEALGWGIPIVAANIRVCAGNDTACTVESAGIPGQFFTVRVASQPIPVIFPQFWWRVMSTNGISARATAQNEYVF
jgi:hypothetical protein